VKVYINYYYCYFCGHLSKELKVKFQRKECDLVEVVGGMTRQHQTLDVSVSESFNDY
jgi:DNA-binding transcriptional regulator LsrR (DeoR family)